MSRLDEALKRFEQVATLGMRESDYKQVDDSLAWFREDLAVVKTALSKKDELLGLFEEKADLLVQIINNQNSRHPEIRNELQDKYMTCLGKINTLKKEIEEMK